MPQASEIVKYIRVSVEIEDEYMHWARQRAEDFNDFINRLLTEEKERQK